MTRTPATRPERPLDLRALHDLWAWVFVVGNGAVGAWALAAHRWPRLHHAALWWLTVAAQVAIFLQVGIGVAMVAVEGRSVDDLHMFYGFVALVAVAIIHSYRHQLRHRLHLLYGLGGLFLMGLGIRAMVINPA